MDDVRRRMKGIFYIGRGSISRGADATTSKVAVGSRSRRTSGTITALILGSERSPRATAPRLTQVRLEKEQVTEVKATDASRSGVHHQGVLQRTVAFLSKKVASSSTQMSPSSLSVMQQLRVCTENFGSPQLLISRALGQVAGAQ